MVTLLVESVVSKVTGAPAKGVSVRYRVYRKNGPLPGRRPLCSVHLQRA